jgi:hypothetical protein
MKAVNILLTLSAFVLVASISVVTTSCDDEDKTPLEPPTITSFSPASGIVGTTVTITGPNFGTISTEHTVEFNGAPATILGTTGTELTVTVPAEATTGKISITRLGMTATSATDFIVPAPTITSYSPAIAAAGISVSITGTNFSSVTTDNIVEFNGVNATVTAASATGLTVTVPAGATSGGFTVKVGANTAISSANFDICSGSAELLISDIVLTNTAGATSYLVSFKVTNVGAENADLATMGMQNYASTDNALGNDIAASGFDLSAGPTLAPGESYTTPNFSCNIVGGNTSSHPFLVITLSGTVTECNEVNNLVIVPFD